MMTTSFYELAIIGFIVAVMGFLIWRGGARNPVPTGGLDKSVTAIGTKLDGVQDKVNEIEDRVEAMEGKYAKVSDIRRLERRLEAHDAKIDEVGRHLTAIREDIAAGQAQRAATSRQLDMIYEVIVKKGMD